jgi:hypothetical protein
MVIMGNAMRQSLFVAFLTAVFICGFALGSTAKASTNVTGIIQASPESESIPQPSVPEFTVEFVNGTIEVKIKNQPFVSYYDTSIGWNIDFHYNIRIKGDFSEDWTELYLIEEVPTHSSSEYTMLSYALVGENTYILGNKMIEFPSGAQIDFQVEAMIGYVHRVYNPNATSHLEMYPYVFTGEKSGWSETQTITLPTATPSSSPSPTSTPKTPETMQFEAILGAVIAAAVIGAGLGLLIYLIKRK